MRSTVHEAKSKIWNELASRDDGIEVTLLPIPNRKVKVYSADGTAWETVWQSRTLRGKQKKIVVMTIFFYFIIFKNCKKIGFAAV